MTDRTGQSLGHYTLIRMLGRGGFADVYLGEHIYLKTQAAIKVLHAQISQDSMEQFLAEARTIARLMHPHIVRVHDFGVDNATPFLVMEYAPNGTLRQRHPRGTVLPLALVVPYSRQIAGALQYAHDQRLIHRDVKPENMLLGYNNEVLLSDFGIATIAQTSRSLPTQDISGTIAYMAPEQVQGKARPTSDQYSLAVIVYEWLTGRCPFQGSFTEIATQQLFTTPASPRSLNPSISPEVEHILMTALSKNPEARFARVEAFANALDQASRPGQISPTVVEAPFMNPSPTSSTGDTGRYRANVYFQSTCRDPCSRASCHVVGGNLSCFRYTCSTRAWHLSASFDWSRARYCRSGRRQRACLVPTCTFILESKCSQCYTGCWKRRYDTCNWHYSTCYTHYTHCHIYNGGEYAAHLYGSESGI